MGKDGLFMSIDMSDFLKKFNMRKIHKIVNIVLIFMLISMFLFQNLVYSFNLRVPISDTTREKEALEKISKLKYAETLNNSLHILDNYLTYLALDITGLFYKVDAGKKEEILKKLGEVFYPDNLETTCDQALKLFSKTNDPTEYIWEAEKKIEFYKNTSPKILEFTFFTDEELENFSSTLNHEKKELMRAIKKDCKKVIVEIKDFESRPKGERYIKEINLNKWCEAYLRSIVQSCGRSLDIECSINIPDDLMFSADEYELKQIFWNLAVNSIRAMEKNNPDKPTIKITAQKTDNKLIITISDNGAGLDEENIKKIALEKGKFKEKELQRMSTPQVYNLIFEDWFTTRQGGGQGMGIVLNNIRKYNGTIDVQSESGKGATFTITLPVLQEKNPILKDIEPKILLVKRSERDARHKFIVPHGRVIDGDESFLIERESLEAALKSCIGVGLIGKNKGMWHTYYRPDVDKSYFPLYNAQTKPIKGLFREKKLTAVIVPSVLEESLPTLNNIKKYLKTRNRNTKVFILNPFDYFSEEYDMRISTLIKIEETGKISLFFSGAKEKYIGTMIFSNNKWRWIEIDERAIKAGYFKKEFIESIRNILITIKKEQIISRKIRINL